MKPRILSTVTW